MVYLLCTMHNKITSRGVEASNEQDSLKQMENTNESTNLSSFPVTFCAVLIVLVLVILVPITVI